jgi:asparagine synthase (glutamine-hydrolysing)
MCGICGIATFDPREKPLGIQRLRAMTDVITHRGPDDSGHAIMPGAALGMRRLSIIDIAGGRQPVHSEDERVSAVFNGEIYNFPQLREELAAQGHRLRTNGDSETIVHLYEQHGLDFVGHLRGMFAIALWDAPRRRLVLVRDRMGVKPLYYTTTDRGLAFASEVKALIAGGLVTPQLDPLAGELFLAHGFVPGPRTLFAGVRKLSPASMLVFEDGAQQGDERAYWHPWSGEAPSRRGASWKEDTDRLLELLRLSVRARMISDVPLGVMLSGGLDSSLITALMAERSSGPVQTFSIGFDEDGDSDELADARAVARRLGTDHHELRTSAVDHPDLLDRAIWHLEEPIADISCLGFLLLSALARKTVTVALCGMGADELLGGYRKHEIALIAARTRRFTPHALRAAGAALARMPSNRSTVARGVLAITTDDPAERLLAMSRVVQAGERIALLDPGFRHANAEAEIAAVVRANLPPVALSPLGEVLHLDARLALVDNMHLYVDKMSMAQSLEVRSPFMDHDVVSFCARLPDSRRVWRLHRKELLKRASAGLVSQATITKRKQGFFHSALGAWLTIHREGFVAESLLDERARGRGVYRQEAVQQLVQHARLHDKKASQRLFCLLALERWQRLFVDGAGAGDGLDVLPSAALGVRGGRAAGSAGDEVAVGE